MPSAWAGFDDLLQIVRRSQRLVVLSGAGCSTASGIPDYRDADGAWKRTPPMRYQEFIAHHAARQRYWARALLGWQQFRNVQPSRAHRVLAEFEAIGRVHGVITQNVDGLHQQAGSRHVVDLHGRIDRVQCLQCHRLHAREHIQAALAARNPSFTQLQASMAPDGDALLVDADFDRFEVLGCMHCGGVLKPAVVFFGESVPRQTVHDAFAMLEQADALLVVGSSLMVFSGYRFVRRANERGIPVAVVNLGRTRADAEIDVKVAASCDSVLAALQRHLPS